MRFADVPGHTGVKETLRAMADNKNIPHAILLSGREGVGKMMLARAFAQYVHCEHPEGGEPCGVCASCRMHAELSHPDVHYIYPIVKNEKQKITLSTDRLEEWKDMMRRYPTMPQEEWLALLEAGNSQPAIYVYDAEQIIATEPYPPMTADTKFYIVWQPERLRIEAANKLLKVIEEPSPGTIFILVSDNELQLLPTIYSRTQRLHLGSIAPDEMRQYLADRYRLNEQQAIRMASMASGNLTTALRLGENSGEGEEFLAMYADVMRAAYAKRPALLRSLSEKVAAYGREKIRRFLTYMNSMARENFMYNLRMPQLNAMTPEEEGFATRFSPFVNHANVEDLLRETDMARRDIERNGNAKIVLFDLFIHIIPLLHKRV